MKWLLCTVWIVAGMIVRGPLRQIRRKRHWMLKKNNRRESSNAFQISGSEKSRRTCRCKLAIILSTRKHTHRRLATCDNHAMLRSRPQPSHRTQYHTTWYILLCIITISMYLLLTKINTTYVDIIIFSSAILWNRCLMWICRCWPTTTRSIIPRKLARLLLWYLGRWF